jgi:hypothetical protein
MLIAIKSKHVPNRRNPEQFILYEISIIKQIQELLLKQVRGFYDAYQLALLQIKCSSLRALLGFGLCSLCRELSLNRLSCRSQLPDVDCLASGSSFLSVRLGPCLGALFQPSPVECCSPNVSCFRLPRTLRIQKPGGSQAPPLDPERLPN